MSCKLVTRFQGTTSLLVKQRFFFSFLFFSPTYLASPPPSSSSPMPPLPLVPCLPPLLPSLPPSFSCLLSSAGAAVLMAFEASLLSWAAAHRVIGCSWKPSIPCSVPLSCNMAVLEATLQPPNTRVCRLTGNRLLPELSG